VLPGPSSIDASPTVLVVVAAAADNVGDQQLVVAHQAFDYRRTCRDEGRILAGLRLATILNTASSALRFFIRFLSSSCCRQLVAVIEIRGSAENLFAGIRHQSFHSIEKSHKDDVINDN
jgi:hypothetical protein